RWRSGSAWGRAAGPGTDPAYDTAPHLTRGDPMQEPAAVLTAARDNAAQVDRDGAFPQAAGDALRRLGLPGLALPGEGGGMGRGPEDFAEVLAPAGGHVGIGRDGT